MLVWDAGATNTKIHDRPGNDNDHSSMATTKQAVDGCLKDLGRERVTDGKFSHDLMHKIAVPLFPLGLLGGMIA